MYETLQTDSRCIATLATGRRCFYSAAVGPGRAYCGVHYKDEARLGADGLRGGPKTIETPLLYGPFDGLTFLRAPSATNLAFVRAPWVYDYALEEGRLVYTGERWLDFASIAAEVERFEPAFREAVPS